MQLSEMHGGGGGLGLKTIYHNGGYLLLLGEESLEIHWNNSSLK